MEGAGLLVSTSLQEPGAVSPETTTPREEVMPATFGIALFLFLLALIAVPVQFFTRRRADQFADEAKDSATDRYGHNRAQDVADTAAIVHMVAMGVLAVGLGLGALLTLVSSFNTVGTREVGVITSFGRPEGAVGNGIHFIAPWKKITTLDGAIQTDSFTNADHNCVTVRIAHQATACTDVSIRWQIELGAADQLFRDYRQFDHIRDSLVTRDLRSALNDQFESYDVLAVDSKGISTAPAASQIAQQVTAEMNAKIGGQIKVLSVIIPVMHFDDSTQARLNDLQAQIAKTRIAQQAELTAKAQAAANELLAASVSHDPNVLVSRCYDLLAEAINKGYPLPAGFSCVGGSGVIVSAGNTK